jgi:hypothetical protein
MNSKDVRDILQSVGLDTIFSYHDLISFFQDLAVLQFESLKKQLPEISIPSFGVKQLFRLADKLKSYIVMARPIESLFGPDAPKTYPDYQSSKPGEIDRYGNAALDWLICQTAVYLHGKVVTSDQDKNRFCMDVIHYYGTWPVIQELLWLPVHFYDLYFAKKTKGAKVVVAEDLMLYVFMGVENLLFEIYCELPAGGHIDDIVFRRKLVSLIEGATLTQNKY